MLVDESLQTKEKGKAETAGGRSRLLLWVLVFSMGVLLLALSLIVTTIQDANVDLENRLEAINQSLAVTPAPNPTELALRENLLALQGESGELDLRLNELESAYFNWPNVMNVIANYDASQMQLVALVQQGNRLNMTGHAQDESFITSYVENLRNSGYFVDVTIQSISLKTEQSRTNADSTPAASYLEFILLAEIEAGQS